MPPKVGDVVRYSIQGKTYNALVLFAHSGQVDHLGSDDEPLLHLAFIAPERESPSARSKPGYIPEVFVEYDVVHVSHEFSEEYKRAHGLVTEAQIVTQRGNGEWSELEAPPTWPSTEIGSADVPTSQPAQTVGFDPAATVSFDAAPPAPPLHDVPVSETGAESAPPVSRRRNRGAESNSSDQEK